MTVVNEVQASAPVGWGRGVAAELDKLLTLPRHRMLGVVAVLGAVLAAALLLASMPVTQGRALHELSRSEIFTTSLLGVDVAAVVVVVLAAFFTGAEFSSGMVEQTFVLVPRRRRVLTAKLAVMAIVGLVVGLLAVAGTTALGALVAVAVDPQGTGPSHSLLRLAAGSLLMPVFYGLVATAAGLLWRGVGPAILTCLALMGLPTVVGWLPSPVAQVVLPVLPASSLHSLAGVAGPGSPELVPIGMAVVVLVAWVLVVTAIAGWRLQHRDV